jgi:hypothetical protein
VIYDVLLRLEPDPHQRDLARGWSAELADPAWLLGRQWQLAEHQGEDASWPLAVEARVRTTPIGAVPDQERLDPALVPAEAILESEPGDWWTVGRRVRLGHTVAAAATADGVDLPDDVTLAGLPVPYDALNGSGPDGYTLWRRRGDLGLDEAWFGDPGPPHDEPADLWDPAELSYRADLPAGDTTLAVRRHDGGDLDWYHADAAGGIGDGGDLVNVRTNPGRLRYPSAPLPRWWQIEDAQVSIGGQAPDRASLATMLLIDLIVNHSDDWFTFTLPARSGTVMTYEDVSVVDSFGDRWSLAPPADWSVFMTSGLDPRSLVLWATARTPLAGPVLDQVVIGIDEDANLVWAVEQVVAGRTLPTPDVPAPPIPVQADDEQRPTFSYLPMTPVPRYWHPYVVEDIDGRRRFVQGRAADLSGREATLLPPPVSDLLADPHGRGGRPIHQLEPAAIPAEGLLIERRAMLARAVDGEPVLWTQRRRVSLDAPPTFTLRFDVLRPDQPAE